LRRGRGQWWWRDAGLCDCGDAYSELDIGESERHLGRGADGFGRIQRERGADVYRGRSGNVRDRADYGDADCGRRRVYGDAGQRYDWEV